MTWHIIFFAGTTFYAGLFPFFITGWMKLWT
jgi:hypothetical protein